MSLLPLDDDSKNSVLQVRGFWEPITATIDWCEENYQVTRYVVEFWNTMSSLLFIGAGWFGWREHRRLPVRCRMVYAGIALVGVGSTLFHGTLKYSMQLLDELPMVYTEAYMLACFCGLWARVLLLIGCVAFTIAYSLYRNPLLHEFVFGTLQVACLVLFYKGCSGRKDPRLWRAFYGAFLFTLVAFIFWNIDNLECGGLRSARSRAGPLSAVLELHAWWHVLSCVGAYWWATGMSMLLPEVLALRPSIEFRLFGLMPVLVLGDKVVYPRDS